MESAVDDKQEADSPNHKQNKQTCQRLSTPSGLQGSLRRSGTGIRHGIAERNMRMVMKVTNVKPIVARFNWQHIEPADNCWSQVLFKSTKMCNRRSSDHTEATKKVAVSQTSLAAWRTLSKPLTSHSSAPPFFNKRCGPVLGEVRKYQTRRFLSKSV